MSYSIATLLTRNLHDVFGENDPVHRRAAIDEIFTKDCVFYDRNSRPWAVSALAGIACGGARRSTDYDAFVALGSIAGSSSR